MAKHEFGIIDSISQESYNEYAPEKYGCISIHDDYIMPLLEEFNAKLMTFYHSTSRPATGLSYCGITLIPPESLGAFQEILLNQHNAAYDELLRLISSASEQNKFIIHYGI